MRTKHPAIQYTLATVFLFSLDGCVLAKKKAVPLSPNDSAQLDKPFSFAWTPILNKTIDQRPVILGTVLFDGTWNDRSHVPREERQTIEGHLYDELHGLKMPIFHYYPGAGTQPDKFESLADGAFGYSIKGTAENAVKEVISEITLLRRRQPNADVRLLVSGFSRGAAAARHFMNTLEQRWDALGSVGTPPTFYALIFDTVSTGQRKNLQLQVPVRADIFYHFVSEDERRVFFDLILDDPQNDPDGRVVTIERPGVHSDVGASYNTGIGSAYIAYTNALLSGMGLTPSQCYEIDGDVRSQGKNDSRWLLERAIGIGAPNTPNAYKYRNASLVPISPMSEADRKQWLIRMLTLQIDDHFSRPLCVNEKYLGMLHLFIKHFQNSFIIISPPPLLLPNAKIQYNGTDYVLTYFADGVTPSRIAISTSILNSIPEGQSAHLDLGIVKEKDNSLHFWWFLDNVLVQEVDGTFYKNQ